MSKLSRIASAAVLVATTTFLAPVIPAKDKKASAQTTETAAKDAKAHKEAKHKKSNKTADSEGDTAAAKPAAPKK